MLRVQDSYLGEAVEAVLMESHQQKQAVLDSFEENGQSANLAGHVIFRDVYLEAHLLPGPWFSRKHLAVLCRVTGGALLHTGHFSAFCPVVPATKECGSREL